MNRMCKDDGSAVAGKRPGTCEVPDSFESITRLNEIVLAVYSKVKLLLHDLRHCWLQRVVARAAVPNVKGIGLNGRELWCVKKARDVEHLTNSTNRASRSSFSHLLKHCLVKLTQKYRWRCKYSFVSRSPLTPSWVKT